MLKALTGLFEKKVTIFKKKGRTTCPKRGLFLRNEASKLLWEKTLRGGWEGFRRECL